MESGKCNEEVDIYDDLPDFNLEASIQKLEVENKVLTQKVKDLSTRVTELETYNSELKRVNKNLRANISALLKTVQHEIRRKDSTINELRQEREDLFFRRKKLDSDRPKKPDSDRPKNPDSGRPKNPDSGRPKKQDIDRSKKPDSDRSKNPDSDRSKNPDSDRSKNPDSDRSEKPDSDRSEKPDSDRPKNPDSDRPKNPDSDRPKKQNIDRSKNPDSDRSKKPDSDHSKKPDSDRSKKPDSDSSKKHDSDSSKKPDSDRPNNPDSDRPKTPTVYRLVPLSQTNDSGRDVQMKRSTRRVSTNSESSAKRDALVESVPAPKVPLTNSRKENIAGTVERVVKISGGANQIDPRLSQNVQADTTHPKQQSRKISSGSKGNDPTTVEQTLLTDSTPPQRQSRKMSSGNKSNDPTTIELTLLGESTPPRKRIRKTSAGHPYVKTRSSARLSAKVNSSQEISNDSVADTTLFEALQLESKIKYGFANSPMPKKLSPFQDNEKSLSPLRFSGGSSLLDTNPLSTPVSGMNSLLFGALKGTAASNPQDQKAPLAERKLSSRIRGKPVKMQAGSGEARRITSCGEENTQKEEEPRKERKSDDSNGISDKEIEPSTGLNENVNPSYLGKAEKAQQKISQKGVNGKPIVDNVCNPHSQPAPSLSERESPSQVHEKNLKLQACSDEAKTKISRSGEEVSRRKENRLNEEPVKERKHDDNTRKEEVLLKNGISSKGSEPSVLSYQNVNPPIPGKTKEAQLRASQKEFSSNDTSLVRNNCNPLDQQADLRDREFSSQVREKPLKLQDCSEEAEGKTVRVVEENIRDENKRNGEESRKERKLDSIVHTNGISGKEVGPGSSPNENLKPGSTEEVQKAPQKRPLATSEESSLVKNGCLPLKSVNSQSTRKPGNDDDKRNPDSSALQCDFKVRRRTRVQLKIMVKTPPCTQNNKSGDDVISKVVSESPTDRTVSSVVNKHSHKRESLRSPPGVTDDRTAVVNKVSRKEHGDRSPPRCRNSRRDDTRAHDFHRERGFRLPPPRYRQTRRDDYRTHGFNFSRRSRSVSPRFLSNRRYEKKVERVERVRLAKLPTDKKEREMMLFGNSPDRSPINRNPPQRPVVLTVNVRRKNTVQLEDEESNKPSLVPKPVSKNLSSQLVKTPIDFREKYAEVFSNTGESSDSESGAVTSESETHFRDSDDSYRPKKKRKKERSSQTKSKKLCKDGS